ncbi:MAG: hypothetical protein JWL68_712 [Actinomycetia bacterium]|nr:hypothetical protein [Actinomycetes bacterium]
MSATELDDVQTLLERVLPDPGGFAQRLALQAMERWGQSATARVSAPYAAAAEDVTADGIVITPEPPDEDGTAIDMTMLLAAALGACECWGLRPGCARCWGDGSAGWARPDPELFEEFVKPAMARVSCISPVDNGRDTSVKSGDYRDNRHTAEGENL